MVGHIQHATALCHAIQTDFEKWNETKKRYYGMKGDCFEDESMQYKGQTQLNRLIVSCQGMNGRCNVSEVTTNRFGLEPK